MPDANGAVRRWHVYADSLGHNFRAPSVPPAWRDPLGAATVEVRQVALTLDTMTWLSDIVTADGTTLEDLDAMLIGYSVAREELPTQ